MEYTFLFSHRSGTQYLVSIGRQTTEGPDKGVWLYRWRDRGDSAPWVEWDTLDLPVDASLDDAVAQARHLMSRLRQSGEHRTVLLRGARGA